MSMRSIFSLLLLFALFSSCNSKKNTVESKQDISSIYNNSWELASWKSESVEKTLSTMQTIHLLFDEEKLQLSGNDGCNDFFAGFKLKGDQLNIGPKGGTKKYCGDESAIDERAFSQFLEKTITVSFNNKSLLLTSDSEVLTFKVKK